MQALHGGYITVTQTVSVFTKDFLGPANNTQLQEKNNPTTTTIHSFDDNCSHQSNSGNPSESPSMINTIIKITIISAAVTTILIGIMGPLMSFILGCGSCGMVILFLKQRKNKQGWS